MCCANIDKFSLHHFWLKSRSESSSLIFYTNNQNNSKKQATTRKFHKWFFIIKLQRRFNWIEIHVIHWKWVSVLVCDLLKSIFRNSNWHFFRLVTVDNMTLCFIQHYKIFRRYCFETIIFDTWYLYLINLILRIVYCEYLCL